LRKREMRVSPLLSTLLAPGWKTFREVRTSDEGCCCAYFHANSLLSIWTDFEQRET
jgi:hypothetical protein